MLLGLLLGNLVDLDHVYYRLIGKVGWFESACTTLGDGCRFGFYPLHNFTFAIIFLAIGALVFCKDWRFRLAGWIGIGAFLNIILDYIHMITGFGF
jgi:membrane-bound metal-dependent hydrolase YbcI (DUF457 family)